MKGRPINFFLFPFLLLVVVAHQLFAQRGKDGARVVALANTIVNEYTILTSDVSSGGATINVANSALNSGGYFGSSLAPGDLIFIIQMQGATISTPDDSTYGAITSYGNCGNNEFAQVSDVPGSTSITLDCGLKNTYTSSGRVQVVRVPRYSSLTINSSAVLTSPAWNGSTGGVIVVEVLGSTIINSGGKIDLSGKGFRGGVLSSSSQFGVGNYRWTTPNSGAEKGEGIAGFGSDYDLIGGRYTRGAPANGGGGGCGHNSGGGGGANSGNINGWNGHGNPDVFIASWSSAWNLEGLGFANNTSSGGGRGGYSYSANNQDALTIVAGNTNWGGDYRRNNGGLGGRPLDYSIGRLFLGGGGGAGDQNQNKGTAGGSGGGLAYLLCYSDVSGSGQIISNGTDVPNTPSSGTDGCGGGGAGGTIIVNTTGIVVSSLSLNANGGRGGSQVIYNIFNLTEAEGPGGGGGGGYIAISNGTPTQTATGGNNGTTDSGGMTEFPPNGATKAAVGLTFQSINSFYIQASNNVTICSGSSATLTASIIGTPPSGATYYWYNTPTGGIPIATGSSYSTAVLTSSTTYYIGTCPGTYRLAVPVNIDLVTVSFNASNGCIGAPTAFSSTASSSQGIISGYNWDFGDGNTSSAANPIHNYASANTYSVTLTATDNQGCSSSSTSIITVYPKPQAAFSASNTSGCGPLTVSFANNTINGNTYIWNFGDGNSSSQTNPTYTYSTSGTYTVTLISNSSNGCADTLSKTNYIVVNAKPSASFTAGNVCIGDTTIFSNTSTGATSYFWNFGDGNTASATNPSHVYSSANSYTVTLIASNGGCLDSTKQIVAVAPPPTVGFSHNGGSVCDSLTVIFNNTTTGASSYNWNFGDGNSSGLINPTHTYNVPGTYFVNLTASSGNCSSSKTSTTPIIIYATPHAIISVPNTFVCLNGCANFNSTVTGAPTTWSWSFPGSITPNSLLQNPTNICYLNGGTYSVSLTVSNANCTSSQTLNNYIIVDECAPPRSQFYSTDTAFCKGSCITFYNNSQNAISYQWSFPGGTPSSSTQTNPTVCYLDTGNYNVTLVSTNNFTSDSLIMQKFIRVSSPPSNPSFIQNGDTLNCSVPASYYQWYFNGVAIPGATHQQHVASQTGNYSVTVDPNGCPAPSQPSYVTITGIDQLSGHELLYIYPNPFDKSLNLLIEKTIAGTARLKMMDAIGKVIFEKDIKIAKQPFNASFDFSDLASGVYLISIETDKSTIFKKVVKQ